MLLPDPRLTLIDLRSADLREREPMPGRLPNRVLPLTLVDIEEGRHGLTPADGPLLVVCERGVRSGLAARFLRADGLEAAGHPGGVPALLRALEEG